MGLLVLLAVAGGLWVLLVVAGVVWQMNRPRRKTLAVALGMGGVGDPAELGMAGREVSFNLSDGSVSPGWIVAGDRADDPTAPGAVVVHGHRDSRFGSLYRAEMLRRYVAWSVVFDLPGHGDAAARSCTMAVREPADVWAVVEGLEGSMLAGRPLVLLGYSMGAVIATRAAAERDVVGDEASDASEEQRRPRGESSGARGRLAGVVACAPYRYWDEGLRGQMRRRRLPQVPTVWLVGAVLSAAAWVSRRWGRRRGWGWGQPPGLDTARLAARVSVPLLVLHGDADRVCPLSAGRAVAEAAPRGRLVVVPGGTHNQLLAADGELVHRELSAFFEQLDRQWAEDHGQTGG